MNTEERNREIEESMKIGARAFAAGATLILILAITGVPGERSGDVSPEFRADAASVASVSAADSSAIHGVDSRELSP